MLFAFLFGCSDSVEQGPVAKQDADAKQELSDAVIKHFGEGNSKPIHATVYGDTLFWHFTSEAAETEMKQKLEEYANMPIFGPSGKTVLGEQEERIVCAMIVDGLDLTVPAFGQLMLEAEVRTIAYSHTDIFCLYSEYVKEEWSLRVLRLISFLMG